MPKLSSTRRQLLTAMMKEAIYEAAVAVLSEHGVEGMTMDRVASAAGLAKGSLYKYFPGKQSLLQFVHVRSIDPILRAVEEIVHRTTPAPDKLEAVLGLVFGHLAKHHELFTLLEKGDTGSRALLKPKDPTTRETTLRQYTAIFRQGIDEGLFEAFNPRQLAEMFFGAMLMLWQRSLATGEFRKPDRLIQPLARVFLHGLTVRDRRQRPARAGRRRTGGSKSRQRQ
jgi:AcrR family transcriptional regulator